MAARRYAGRIPECRVEIALILFLPRTTVVPLSRSAYPDSSGKVAGVCAACWSWAAEDRNSEADTGLHPGAAVTQIDRTLADQAIPEETWQRMSEPE